MKRIRAIANRVRKEFDQGRSDPRWRAQMGYNIRPSLGGLCGPASERIVHLARRAGVRGIRIQSSECGGHTFVRWRDWLIDVTATQFRRRGGYRPVEIIRVNGARLPIHWRPYLEERP